MKGIPQKISIADIAAQSSPVEDRTRAGIRRAQLLSIASELFGRKGFEPTSMRDIATAAGIMSGSLYYHFASKEDLYVAVMDASIAKLFNAVEQAIIDIDDPWQRLESAAVAHCEAMLSRSGFRVLTTYIFPPGLAPAVRLQLVEQRDRFERMMGAVITALPLADGIDPKIFRHQYLCAINSIPVWYRPDGPFTADQIAKQFVRTIRAGSRRNEPESTRKPGLEKVN
jgi:AcrR family transcriptional regulator